MRCFIASDYFDGKTFFIAKKKDEARHSHDKPREVELTDEEIKRAEDIFLEWEAVQQLLENKYNAR